MNIGWIFLISALLILLLIAFAPWRRKEQKMSNQGFSARLDMLDAKLKRSSEVIAYVRAGQMIKAIKIYREDTGASLMDAKAAVERMEQAGYFGAGPQEPQITEEVGTDAAIPLSGEVERLVLQGNKIAAIKLYRELTGGGLREAKDAIDALEHGHQLRGSTVNREDVLEGQPSLLATQPDEEIRRYVLSGDKIRAIKLYRERTGTGLREAKEAVDLLERTLRYGL